ncbi:MAG: hypothetical protein ACLRQ0_06425 [Monoglobales bacterium]
MGVKNAVVERFKNICQERNIKMNELAVDVPNAETLAAIDDVNNNRNMSKTYDDMDELMMDLNT